MVTPVLVALAAWTAAMTQPGSPATPAPTPPDEDPWLVVDVIDGDTLDVARGDVLLRVRLIGINAPEGGECWAAESTERLDELVGPGPVWLTTDRSDVDRFGRALRYVTNRELEDVGALLIESGDAIARSYPPDTANDDRYSLLQEAARLDERGLWSPTACGTGSADLASTTAVAITIRYDAAGNDNENLNDEWVQFTNTSAEPLDLHGWTVRDESATNRYRFTDLVLPPGGTVTLFSGCGTDTATERYWCNTYSAVWNNAGDTVFLLDPDGNVVAHYGY